MFFQKYNILYLKQKQIKNIWVLNTGYVLKTNVIIITIIIKNQAEINKLLEIEQYVHN